MKKILLGFSLIILVQAQTPTPVSLKDKLISNIASRVAQLKLVEKRGIVGKVVSVTNTQITVTDFNNETRFVDVDELTKFSNPDVKGTYGISDITKDTTLGILGLYNKESRRILARFVNVVDIPTVTVGTVSSINRSSFTFEVLTDSENRLAFDVETFTKTFSYTKNTGPVRSGFSQIKENYRVIIVGKSAAKRIIMFPLLGK